jgi:hypothetical protein
MYRDDEIGGQSAKLVAWGMGYKFDLLLELKSWLCL